MDGNTDNAEHQAPYQTANQRLPEHMACCLEIVGTNKMCHLNRETHIGCRGESAHEPGGGFYQSNGGRSFFAQMTNHGCVDDKHDRGRNLGKDRGNTQTHNEAKLFASRHCESVANIRK